MVLKREVVERRLEDLDWTLQRLARHRDVDLDTYEADPDLQWIVERGLHQLDASLVLEHLRQSFETFPRFAREILEWLESLEEGGGR